jgi:hypothetical protein
MLYIMICKLQNGQERVKMDIGLKEALLKGRKES